MRQGRWHHKYIMEMKPSSRREGLGVDGLDLSGSKALESSRALGAALGRRGDSPAPTFFPAAVEQWPRSAFTPQLGTHRLLVWQGNNEFQFPFSSGIGSEKQSFLL